MKSILLLFIAIPFLGLAQNSDVISVADRNSKESVSFRRISTSDEGKKIDDQQVDDVIYKKINGNFYKRVIPQNIVDVTWFGNTSDAIQKAVDFASVNLGPWKRAKYSIYLPEGTYVIDKPIKITNVEGIHIYGGGIGTLLEIKENTKISSIFELNGTAYGVYENFYFGGAPGSSCDNFIYMYWGDKKSDVQPVGYPKRSSTQNSFTNIRNISGKFKDAVRIDGHNQNDMSMWYNCSFNGNWTPKEKDFFQSAFNIGDGTAGNNLIHNFQNSYIVGVKNAFIFGGVGGSITGGGASNVDTYIVRNNPNETLLVSGVRLEGTSRIYRNEGYLNGIHEYPDNVTFQNLWYSASGSPHDYFDSAADGILIFHGGGTLNIMGSTFTYFPKDKKIRIKLSGAMNNNFHNAINIIGSNIPEKFENLFIVDSWAHASANVIGSNETAEGGMKMGNHVHQWMKDFNYKSTSLPNK
ncbi:hypothetical protein [Chryseobacterium koreense]|uniref:Pectate lyase superfamily protein domain-containing protein n=1 Tax=Chryseobacterium koreense CCUG 49689 TaxID=1304281 RepID=A0A0J7LQ00_9FLAO|nr:hypothetical protein [Chryseobacterium koreense]KMQ71130.1 hypothetical protein ACM44_08080 [Chryseobacterium koreense CCUG 49689]MBB5332748.1 hypothetical protein [Chryseobacterium koreense]